MHSYPTHFEKLEVPEWSMKKEGSDQKKSFYTRLGDEAVVQSSSSILHRMRVFRICCMETLQRGKRKNIPVLAIALGGNSSTWR